MGAWMHGFAWSAVWSTSMSWCWAACCLCTGAATGVGTVEGFGCLPTSMPATGAGTSVVTGFGSFVDV